MYQPNLEMLSNAVSRSISPENRTGEKGKGGMDEVGVASHNARDLGKGWKISPYIIIQPGETVTLADIEGPGVIKHIWLTGIDYRGWILRIYWDNSEIPSVECPIGDFFAHAYNDGSQFVHLNSSMVCVNPGSALNCYWNMPFYKHCKITVESIFPEARNCYYQIDYILDELPKGLGYFHAQFRRVNPLPYKEVVTIMDNVEGKGHYVGTYLFWSLNSNNWWGEGEIKFYMDGDKEYPTICGTGTEDYFCGSYNFDVGGKYQEFCTPYSGVAKVFRPDGLYKANTRFSMYRWHTQDPVYFQKDMKVTIQALGWRSEGRYLPLQDDISSVCFFYLDRICQTPPTLPDKDGLEII